MQRLKSLLVEVSVIVGVILILMMLGLVKVNAMDSNERNPGNDKRQCGSVEECPIPEDKVK